jgi:hypothetical protein
VKIVTFRQSNRRFKEFVPFFKGIIMFEIIFRNDLDGFCDLQDSFAEKGIPETQKTQMEYFNDII